MPAAAPPAVYLRRLALGPMQNFVYLLGRADRPETAVIDAAWDVPAILAAAAEDGRTLTHALVTHRHADHVNGLVPLLEAQAIRIVTHRDEAAHLSSDVPESEIHAVTSGDVVDVGGLEIRCIHTPGHTAGSQCFHVGVGAGALLSGDTVFVNACGRCDFRESDPAKMFDSLRHVLGALPDGTALYPGHDYGDVPESTLGRERAQNPYFAFEDEAAFTAYRMRPRR